MAKVKVFEAEVITKYNHNHDPSTGRFASGSGGRSGSAGAGGTTLKPRDGKQFFDANDLGGLPTGTKVKSKSGKVLQRSEDYSWVDTENPGDKYSLMDLQWDKRVNGISEITFPKDGFSVQSRPNNRYEITDGKGNMHIVVGTERK